MLSAVPLKRRSVCPCGHPVLDEAIQPGVKYSIDLGAVYPYGMYFCGGCRTWYRLQIVFANQLLRPDLPRAPLPYGLFTDTPPVLEKYDGGR